MVCVVKMCDLLYSWLNYIHLTSFKVVTVNEKVVGN